YHKSVIGPVGLDAIASGAEVGPHPEIAAMVGNNTTFEVGENNGATAAGNNVAVIGVVSNAGTAVEAGKNNLALNGRNNDVKAGPGTAGNVVASGAEVLWNTAYLDHF
ncbi:hypothetical protein PIB30_111993, partial [Stylosanthes scabra]|nr:hypothetical protein [Stylosanthes scabra]